MANRNEKLKIIVEAVDHASASLKKVSVSLRGITTAAGVVGAAVAAAGAAMTAAAVQADKAWEAQRRLEAALRGAGVSGDEMGKRLAKLASEIQMMTGISDEAVKSVSEMLLRLGASPQEIERATRATVDFAKAMGIDVREAAKSVGKALAGNTSILQRYGLAVKDVSDVLPELERAFGGVAELSGAGTVGALNALKQSFGDLVEAIGMGLAQTPEFVGLIRGLAEIIQQSIPHVIRFSEAFGVNLTAAFMASIDVAVKLANAINAVLFLIVPIDKFRKKLVDIQTDLEVTAEGMKNTVWQYVEQTRELFRKMENMPARAAQRMAEVSAKIKENLEISPDLPMLWQEVGVKVKESAEELRKLHDRQQLFEDFVRSAAANLQGFIARWTAAFLKIRTESKNVFVQIAADFANMLTQMVAELMAKIALLNIANWLASGPLGGLAPLIRGAVGLQSASAPVPVPVPAGGGGTVVIEVRNASPFAVVQAIQSLPGTHKRTLVRVLDAYTREVL